RRAERDGVQSAHERQLLDHLMVRPRLDRCCSRQWERGRDEPGALRRSEHASNEECVVREKHAEPRGALAAAGRTGGSTLKAILPSRTIPEYGAHAKPPAPARRSGSPT